MLSYEGLMKDLVDSLLKGDKPLTAAEQFDNNKDVFTDEKKSYDATGRDYGIFYEDTFIRTNTGYKIFQEYSEAWKQKLRERNAISLSPIKVSIDNLAVSTSRSIEKTTAVKVFKSEKDQHKITKWIEWMEAAGLSIKGVILDVYNWDLNRGSYLRGEVSISLVFEGTDTVLEIGKTHFKKSIPHWFEEDRLPKKTDLNDIISILYYYEGWLSSVISDPSEKLNEILQFKRAFLEAKKQGIDNFGLPVKSSNNKSASLSGLSRQEEENVTKLPVEWVCTYSAGSFWEMKTVGEVFSDTNLFNIYQWISIVGEILGKTVTKIRIIDNFEQDPDTDTRYTTDTSVFLVDKDEKNMQLIGFWSSGDRFGSRPDDPTDTGFYHFPIASIDPPIQSSSPINTQLDAVKLDKLESTRSSVLPEQVVIKLPDVINWFAWGDEPPQPIGFRKELKQKFGNQVNIKESRTRHEGGEDGLYMEIETTLIIPQNIANEVKEVIRKYYPNNPDLVNSKQGGRAGASSAIQTTPKTPGGIDFRALTMTIQPMGSFSGLNFKLPQLSQAELKQINVNSEMQQIKNMICSGITPSGQRIKELVAACIQKKEMNSQSDSLLVCLADIFKLEEANASESAPELREALVIVDSQG
jgi:hypothetical protein